VSVVWRRAEAVLVFTSSFVLAALVIKYKSVIESTLSTIGPVSYPLAILVFTVVASAPFSVTDALAVMNGVIFGPVIGSLVNAIGLVFAAIAGYALARRTSHLLELEKNIERLPPWVKRFPIGSPQVLLALRCIPGVGGDLAPQIAAAFRVPMFVHVWTMCAVAIPVCTVCAVFGDRVSMAVHAYYEAHKPHMHLPHMHLPHVHMPDSLQHFLHRKPEVSPSP